jgi:hypothetical protein
VIDPVPAGGRRYSQTLQHAANTDGTRARKLQGRMEPARVWQPVMA